LTLPVNISSGTSATHNTAVVSAMEAIKVVSKEEERGLAYVLTTARINTHSSKATTPSTTQPNPNTNIPGQTACAFMCEE